MTKELLSTVEKIIRGTCWCSKILGGKNEKIV